MVKLRERYQAIMAKAGEYTRTLNVSQERTAAAAEVAQAALNSLVMQAYQLEEIA